MSCHFFLEIALFAELASIIGLVIRISREPTFRAMFQVNVSSSGVQVPLEPSCCSPPCGIGRPSRAVANR
jgi:hypothetical protein